MTRALRGPGWRPFRLEFRKILPTPIAAALALAVPAASQDVAFVVRGFDHFGAESAHTASTAAGDGRPDLVVSVSQGPNFTVLNRLGGGD